MEAMPLEGQLISAEKEIAICFQYEESGLVRAGKD